MGQKREAAAPWGVNAYHIYSVSFGLGTAALAFIGAAITLSCFLVALGGTFYAQYFRYINPERTMGMGISVEIAFMGMVGGWQTVYAGGPLPTQWDQ